MIEISQLDFAYKSKPLFNSLNLSLQPGRIYGLLGKNGVGKTTLLKLIAALLYPQNGQITISGMPSHKRYPQYLAMFYLLPEEFDLPQITPETYLKIYAPFYPHFDRTMFYRIASDFEIPMDHKLSAMSYGQKKKFLIAFAMATNTPILIMDEPTNGLDIPSKRLFRRIVAENLDQDRLLVISTHQVKDIEGMIDDIIILENGKIIFHQSLGDIESKLAVIRTDNEPQHALYYEPVLGGYLAIVPAQPDITSLKIDIELLFNAIISDKEKFQQIFKN